LPGCPACGSASPSGRKYHEVALWIAEPHLAVVRATVALGRVAVWRNHDRRAQVPEARHRGVEVVDLEPGEDAVAVRPVIGVAEVAMMVVDLEAVELQDQLACAVHEPLVPRAAVCAARAEEPLIESARRLDVVAHDEGLGAHLAKGTTQEVLSRRRHPCGERSAR
jgi:hypothetical protein